jgi:hypothetical protein
MAKRRVNLLSGRRRFPRCEFLYGIEIRGSAAFVVRTREALDLLEAAGRLSAITPYIGLIRQAKRSGMKAWAKPPTFLVGDRTWQHSALWYAGAIAHDAYHAKLFFTVRNGTCGKDPGADAWIGAEAEKACLAFQQEILRELNADENILGYLAECRKNPSYQGRAEGLRGWLDYLKRWW